MRNLRTVALLSGWSLLVSACGDADVELLSSDAVQDVSFEAFRETAYDEPDSDVYVINGDEAVVGLEGLREYFTRRVRGGVGELGTREDALTASCSNGVYNKWSAAAALNLTYCVSRAGFGSRYSLVVSALNTAMAGWESVANVNFIHLSQYDDSCTASQAGVVFDVRPVNTGGQYVARAFFPNAPRSSRNLLIDNTAFAATSPFPLAGLLRHELGHVLGFVHEYVRVTTSGCYDTSSGCPLTVYDRDSIMHYPQCGGSANSGLGFSTLDQQGAAAYYP
jgi:serralysin